MKNKNDHTTDAASLRQKAEAQLKKQQSKTASVSSEAGMLKLIHELEVHQIELEMQNDELVIAKEKAEIAKEKYTELYDFAPSGYLSLSKEGKITELNFAAAKMLGKERLRLKNSSLGFFISAETKPSYNRFIEKVFSSETKQTCELTLAVSGHPPMHVILSGICNENGQYCKLTATDITERKRAEEATLKSRQRLEFALQGGQLGVWDWNIQTGAVVYSDLWAKLLEYSPEEVEPTVDFFKHHIHPDDKADVLDSLMGHIEGRLTMYKSEHRFRTKSGKWLWVQDHGKITEYDNDSRPVRAVGIIKDITERKQAEKALQEKNDLLERLFDSNFDLVALTDLEGNYTLVGKSHEVLGYDRGYFIGKNLMDFVHPDDAEFVNREELAHYLKSGKSAKIEYRYKRNDGTYLWLESIGTILKNKKGQPEQILFNTRNITESKQAEVRLKKEKAWSESIVNNAPNLIVGLGEKSIIKVFNKYAEILTGYKAEEVLGKEWIDIFVPKEQQETIYQVWHKIVKNKLIDHHLQNEIIIKSGEKRLIEWSNTILTENDEFRMMLSIGKDITVRKQIENELKEKTSFLSTIMETSPVGIVTIDKIGNITYANYRAEQILGLKKEQITSTTYDAPLWKHTDLDGSPFPEEKLPFNVVKKSLETVLNIQHGITWPDGTVVILSVNAAPLKDHNGEFNGMIASIEDITERKNAEKALCQSEEMMRHSQSVAHICSYSTDLTVNEIDKSQWVCSPEFYKIFGIDENYPHTIAAWTNLIHPDYREEIAAYHEAVVKEKKSFNREYKIIRINDGAERWVQGTGELVFDKNGTPVRIHGAIQDITERKQAALKLQHSENRYRTIFNSTGTVTLLVRNNTYIEMANEEALNVTGHTAAELTGTKWTDHVAPHSLEKMLHYHQLRRTNQKGAPDKYEVDLIHKSGEIRRSLLTIGMIPNSELSIVTLIDVTDRYKATEKLKESEERFKALHNASFGGIIIHDKGKILECNYGLSEITAYSYDELIGMDALLLIAPESRDMVMDNILAGYEKPYEAMGIRKNGELFPLRLEARNVPYKGKTVRTAEFRDITEQKQAEEALLIAKEHAEESDRLKSAFLANMSHEIRTPMNGILGFAELLKEPNLTGEEQQKYISVIERSGARMLNILNDIIDISKIEAGLMELDIKETNINEQIEYIYTFFKPEAEAKGMKLSFNTPLPAKEATIATDREKVYAVLTNLVKNAIKYSKDGSIEFGYVKKVGFLEFFVKDTGIGISKDRQEAIFERFIQADIEDKMARQGAGLGLAITKAYIEILGGKIWVESQEGMGSTFFFTLPYNAALVEETAFHQTDTSDNKDNIKKLKILIAEDDEVSEMLLDQTIKRYGKEVLKARTGNEAVEACKNNPDIDLVLMDIRMPDLRGDEATRLIREFNKDVVIIAQTAYGLTGDREKAIEAGCNDYISKPIDKTKLQTLIQKYFGR